MLIAVVIAVVTALAVDVYTSSLLATVTGWDAGGAVMAALAWAGIARADAATTQQHAAAEDFGRGVVYVLVLLSSAASLLVAVVLERRTHALQHGESQALAVLCLLTVALSWLLTHTAFALRYAHLYYREDDEGVGGVEFAGGAPPCYFDFVYFAFTVGMCFQVSDTTVTSGQIRRTVLLHAVLSFAYNTAIMAFVLNLVFAAA
jgi:uncharacterized membrane protein